MNRTAFLLLLCTVAFAAPAFAQSYLPKPRAIGGNPGPAHNYVCPNVDAGTAIDCFFDAVRHLYTMCKHVKSIEIIEFGYEKSDEGLNAAKSAYCLDKQRQNMARPYQAALHEAKISVQARDMLRGLHEYWLDALGRLRWNPGESDDEYKARTGGVYGVLDERITGIKTVVTVVREHTTVAKPVMAKKRAREALRAKAER